MDQLSKLWLVKSLPYGGRAVVIGGFFDLVHVRNRGVAFGLLADGNHVTQSFVLLVVFALVGFVAWQLWQHRHQPSTRISLGLILGGAMGNLVDRFLRGEVVDFLDFYLKLAGRTYHWPAFNIADTAITVGALLLLLQEAFVSKYAPDSH